MVPAGSAEPEQIRPQLFHRIEAEQAGKGPVCLRPAKFDPLRHGSRFESRVAPPLFAQFVVASITNPVIASLAIPSRESPLASATPLTPDSARARSAASIVITWRFSTVLDAKTTAVRTL